MARILLCGDIGGAFCPSQGLEVQLKQLGEGKMSQRAVEHCLGRMITDDQFRRLARESLPHACRQYGYELTSIEIELLGCLDFFSLANVSRLLDPGLHRTGTVIEGKSK